MLLALKQKVQEMKNRFKKKESFCNGMRGKIPNIGAEALIEFFQLLVIDRLETDDVF